MLIPKNCLITVSEKTDTVILFHSATGKDSICLLDMCSRVFKKVHCVFLYIVPNLSFNNQYMEYQKKRYPNCEFNQHPHFVRTSYLKNGQLGSKQDDTLKNESLSSISKLYKEHLGVEYAIIGFKKYDSLTRRIMLNLLPDGIEPRTKNVYPLADCSNNYCLKYIKKHKLIPNLTYGNDRSGGDNIINGEFLFFLKQYFPEDLKKVFNEFPHAKAYLYQYETQV